VSNDVVIDPVSGREIPIGFLVWSARRRVRDGRERRERLRAECIEHGFDIVRLTGETDEQFEAGCVLAQAVVDEYDHLYDEAGELIQKEDSK
jgi:hypothetical protein